MGQSWDFATKEKSAGNFDLRSNEDHTIRLNNHPPIFDSVSGFSYVPYWKNDLLFVQERKVYKNGQIYGRDEFIQYIVGSGQHTNSHLWSSNGYLFQAPFTFYTQQKILDLPPGFEGGHNARFSRIITSECITCHDGYPVFDSLSENRFLSIKNGIDCERCHGPGSIHVEEKLKGISVDINTETDYSIVNPKKLPRDEQINLCQRCHLQGVMVLNEGKTFYDFRPGMMLSEVFNTFLPRYTGSRDNFIMASHADRMKQSACFLKSEMTCLSCHDPHVSVKETPADVFVAKCNACHEPKNTCRLPLAEREVKQNNCISCHMPLSNTIDIPHVQIHDHFIRIHQPGEEKLPLGKLVSLECNTNSDPPPLLMAKGFLEYYEAYLQRPELLDSAEKYLMQHRGADPFETEIRLRFLQNDFPKITALASTLTPVKLHDAWTAYRIGESFSKMKDEESALKYFSRAVELKPHHPEFVNKYGSCLFALGKLEEAKKVFADLVALDKTFAPAQSNLGYLEFLQGKLKEAKANLNSALSLDPDYGIAIFNLAGLYVMEGEKQEAISLLKHLLLIEPRNQKAKEMLNKISNF